MENKPEQLQFKFMEDILKEEQRKEFREDLKTIGGILASGFTIVAMVTMPIWGPIINHYFPDRFHRKDAVARYVEPMDGVSKGAVYQGFDTDGHPGIDKVLVHRVHYAGKVVYVPPGTELTESSGDAFLEAKRLLETGSGRQNE